MSSSTSAATQRWLALESNPEVLSRLIHKTGASADWGLVDVFGLDDELLAFIPQPVAALLLLFPLTEGGSERASMAGGEEQAAPSSVFFMKQTIENACGTVALLHSLGNSKVPITADSPLDAFLKAAKDKMPEERAKLLEENEAIKKIHESFARQGQTATPGVDDSVDLHFVAIVLADGHVFELDGRRAAPVRHGASSEATFLRDAADVCKKFMAAAPQANNFSLAALVKLPKD